MENVGLNRAIFDHTFDELNLQEAARGSRRRAKLTTELCAPTALCRSHQDNDVGVRTADMSFARAT